MKMLRYLFYSFCAVLLLFSTVFISRLHALASPLVISEIKLKNDPTGLDEYIELTNQGSEAIALNTLFIGYANSSAPSADQVFYRVVIAEGMLEPGKSLVLAKNEADANLPNSVKSPFSSLSDNGGSIQITDETGTVLDEVRWTSLVSAAINGVLYLPGTTTAKSQSFLRSRTADGNSFADGLDAWQLATPTPQSSVLRPLLNNLNDVDQSDPTITNGPEQEPEISQPETVEITELLPNPATPQTDEADEFIELHNSSDQVVSLKGLILQSGNNFTYTYSFGDEVLQPDEYKAYMVTQTHLLLSNSGGRSRLLNASGMVLSQTDPYGSAQAGLAWALIDGAWQWTDHVTAHAANIASEVSVTSSTTANASPAKTSVKAAKTTTKTIKAAGKPKATSATKKTTAKTVAKKTTTSAKPKTGASGAKAPLSLHPLILAGVGVGTLLYGSYEYRQDVIAFVRRFRRDRSLWGKTRAQIEGPRGNRIAE